MDKLAIVTSGGGMACAFSAGVIGALVEVHKITNPDIAIASSGSSGNIAYYLAGQYSLGQRVWTELLSSESNFINTKRFFKGNIMDLDYLIDYIFKIVEPLDVNALKSQRTHFSIVVTDYETGEAVYFDNKSEVDIFQVLKASKAAPVVYNNPVIINNRRYIDGDISSSLEERIDKALNEGAEKVLAIDNSQPLSQINSYFFNIYAKKAPEKLQQVIKKYFTTTCTKRDDPRIFYITPNQQLPVGMLDNQRRKLERTIQMGYLITARNTKLKEFLTE